MLKVYPCNLNILKNIFSKFPTMNIQYKSEMEIHPGELLNELRPPISTAKFPKAHYIVPNI